MEPKSRVFISGANGLLATNTIIELLTQGYLIRGLLRNKSKYIGPQHKNLDLIKGDILNNKDLDKALKDCKYAIHIAALTDQNRLNYKDYELINVEGARNVILACIRNKIMKMVYVSSANVFGYGSINNLGNECKKIKQPFTSSYYAISKLKGQEEILKYSHKVETTIVNPTFMIGPYDSKPSSGKIILIGLKNKIVLCPPGGKSFVSVCDVAKGVIQALKKGKNREAYILANNNLTYKEFFKTLRNRADNNFVIVGLPKAILLAFGYFGEMLRYFGFKTDLSLINMRMLCVNNFYSNKKSLTHLEMLYEPIDKSVDKAIKWFSENYS